MSLKKSLEKLKAAIQNSMNVNDPYLLQMQPMDSSVPPTKSPTGKIKWYNREPCPSTKCYSTLETSLGILCMEYTTHYRYRMGDGCVVADKSSYKVSEMPCNHPLLSFTPLCENL